MPKVKEEKTLKSERVYEGKEFSVRRETVELASGKPYKQEIDERPNEVIVVPQLSKDEIILVKQYRRGVKEILLELPGGKMRNGEDEIATVKRELEEETGYEAEKLERLTETFVAPGWSTLKRTFFLARNLKAIEKPSPADPDENIEIVKMPFKEALAAAEKGDIRDAKTILALLWAKKFFTA